MVKLMRSNVTNIHTVCIDIFSNKRLHKLSYKIQDGHDAYGSQSYNLNIAHNGSNIKALYFEISTTYTWMMKVCSEEQPKLHRNSESTLPLVHGAASGPGSRGSGRSTHGEDGEGGRHCCPSLPRGHPPPTQCQDIIWSWTDTSD